MSRLRVCREIPPFSDNPTWHAQVQPYSVDYLKDVNLLGIGICRGRVISSSRGYRFHISDHRHVFVVSVSPCRQTQKALRLGHDHFLPEAFYFNILKSRDPT